MSDPCQKCPSDAYQGVCLKGFDRRAHPEECELRAELLVAARAREALTSIFEEEGMENRTTFDWGYISALRYILGDEALRAAAHPPQEVPEE